MYTYRTCLAICFLFFNFDLEFLEGVLTSIGLHAQIYLITIGFGGRQVLLLPKLKS